MTQPLPDWLKAVTLQYQDTDKFTTGLVELPISYSGPSIPLAWPYTSVVDSPTASPPLPSASPSSTQVMKFIDGDNPFTVLDGIILTTPPPVTRTSLMSATPSSSVVLVSTIVVAQPTPKLELPSSDPRRPSSNPLALGFVILVAVLIVLIFAITILLIQIHARRKSHVGIIGKDCNCLKETHYDFNAGPYPHDSAGSPAPLNPPRNLHHDHIPILIHQHTSVNAHIEEKELMQPETQFHITPQRKPKSHPIEWVRWKNLISKLPIFAKKKVDRAGIVYSQPVPQINPHYSNPYHDPSINTDTEERVCRWRVKCDSPSSSALQLPSTITSNKNENRSDDQKSLLGLSGNVHVLTMDSFGFTNRKPCTEENGVFNFNPSSSVSGPTVKLASRGCLALKDFSSTKVMRAGAMHTLLECASPRRNVITSDSDCSKKSITPASLSKVTAHVSRSLGARSRSSHTTGKGSTSKRYLEDSPPFLIAECDGEAFENDDTDPGDSPLDFITIPLRSPPRCRRGTLTTSPGTHTVLENSVESRSLIPSSSSLPLRCSTQMARQKINDLHASSSASLFSSTGSQKPQTDHVLTPELMPSLTSKIPSSSQDTPTIFERKRGKFPIMKQSHSTFGARKPLTTCPVTMNNSIGNGSSLDLHLGHESPDSVHATNSKNGAAVPVNLLFNSFKLSNEHCPTSSHQGLVTDHEDDTIRVIGEKTYKSCNDDDIISNGCFGSGSIGNTGGVSELGILETSDRSMEIDIEVPTSASSRFVRTSLHASSEPSELVKGEEHSRVLEHLFYVKPQVSHALGSERIKSSTEASNSNPQPLDLLVSGSTAHPKRFLANTDAREASKKISKCYEAGNTLEATNDLKNEGHNKRLTQQEKKASDLSAHPLHSTYYSANTEANFLQPSRRSASSSVIGSLFSFGQQSRRCVSYPSGMETGDADARNSNYLNILPMLNDTRSPLQRITERWRQLSRRVEEDEDEIESRQEFEIEDEMDKEEEDEADENCRLLLAQHA